MHHEFCNVTVPACRTEAGFCDCNGNGIFEPANGETGWNCEDSETLDEVEGAAGFSAHNVSERYRFSLYGVDCADYCPEVCQFQFMNGSGCDAKFVSYELHGNPMGLIRDKPQFGHYMSWVWNQTIPTWTHIHINNADCKIALSAGKNHWSDTFSGAGCKAIPPAFQQPVAVRSKEVCLQAELFYQKTSNDATLDNNYDTRQGGTHHGGR